MNLFISSPIRSPAHVSHFFLTVFLYLYSCLILNLAFRFLSLHKSYPPNSMLCTCTRDCAWKKRIKCKKLEFNMIFSFYFLGFSILLCGKPKLNCEKLEFNFIFSFYFLRFSIFCIFSPFWHYLAFILVFGIYSVIGIFWHNKKFFPGSLPLETYLYLVFTLPALQEMI